MGCCKLLTLEEKHKWHKLLDRTLYPDIFFTPAYFKIFSAEANTRVFVYEKGTCIIMYPFIQRKVETFFDITSPYGFVGPLCSPETTQADFNEFYRHFQDFCRENKIICEFIRFHPLLENHIFMTAFAKIEKNTTAVFVDLTLSPDSIWSGYHRSNRKNINKARREGISVIIDESPRYFNRFLTIYRETLNRNNADDRSYFSPGFFHCIHEHLKDNYIYAYAIKDDEIVSAEMFIYNKFYIHSFLGGTLADYFPFRPNNLLKHEVIRWAREKGIKFFVLGGGKSDNDGIVRYKKTFAPDNLKGFYIGKKIHDEQAVFRLVGTRNTTNLMEGFFPPYRR